MNPFLDVVLLQVLGSVEAVHELVWWIEKYNGDEGTVNNTRV